MADDSCVWVKNKDVPGDVFITPESIYVTNGSDEKYFQFGWRQISDCSFSNNFLELRKDWTENSKYGKVNQYHEEFRLFIPLAKREKVAELVEEFKVMAAANPPSRQRFGLDN